MEALAHLIDAAAHLLASIAWPAALAGLLIFLLPDIRRFFQTAKVEEVSFKAPGGIEGTIKVKIAAALGAAAASSDAASGNSEQNIDRTEAIAATVDAVNTVETLDQLSQKLILWVDDNPRNNKYERHSLAALGLRFVLAESTEEALKLVAEQSFDLIISDMQRPGDKRAGYSLLKKLPSNHVPFIIYRSSAFVEDELEAKRLGAVASTNDPGKLFSIVIRALTDGLRKQNRRGL